ncbi:MAG: type II toxin-antitoxin system RelE/ParE family toxin [Patescibacteria group bacterium]
MGRPLRWLPEAVSGVERLYAFLNGKSPASANRAAETILRGVELLKTTPRLGRPMPDETGRRELFMAYGAGAYVLRYMYADGDTVVIIRVWHSRESRGNIA